MAEGGVKTLLQIEGLAVLAASAGLYQQISGDWKLFAILILAPDASFLGYLFGRRVGALAYNTAHAMIGPLLLAGWGVAAGQHLALAISLIWMAHIGFDRAIGAGLKYATGFGDTHLGRIGRAKAA